MWVNNLSCPKCDSDEVFVARDTYSTRSCGKCFFTWLPQSEVKPVQMSIEEIVKQYSFIYKDKVYCVQRSVKIKSVMGQWTAGIEYRPEYDGVVDATQFYVRTYEDFISKFKPI